MAASSASPISTAQQASAAARASQPLRQQTTTQSFAEALEAQERQLGEPERDSRVARARQQRQPAKASGEIDAAIEPARPQTVSGQPVKEPDDKMAESAVKKTEPPADSKAEPEGRAETDTSATTPDAIVVAGTAATPAPVAMPEAPVAVPVQAPVEAAQETAAVVVASPEAAVGIQGATGKESKAPIPPGVAEVGAEAAAPSTETAEKPAVEPERAPFQAAAPTTEGEKEKTSTKDVAVAAATPPQTPARTETSEKTAAKAEPQRAEPAAAAAAAADPAPSTTAAEPAPAPSQAQATTPTPTTAGPTSFVAEVAQKVAAQTSAAGSPVPVHALAVTIAARASSGATRFDIRLDPAELGRIDVQLTVDREGRVKSKLVVEKQETLDLLQRDQRNLERALSQAGVQTSENSLEFSLKDQGSQNSRDRQPESAAHQRQVVIEDPETVAALQASAVTYARAAALRGGVDIRI